MGTLMGLLKKANLMGDKGQPPELGRAFISDSIGTMASGILGTSTVTYYIESASGVAEGGRTGLTAVVAAILFLAALIFAPLIGLVPGFHCTSLNYCRSLDARNVRVDLDFTGFPAFLTIIGMPLTYSIATGLGLGSGYTVVKLFQAGKDIH